MAIISNPNNTLVVGTALDDQFYLEWNNVTFQWAYGGTGNDLYFLSGDAPDVSVIENAGEGTDTIELRDAYDDFTLGANIENLRIASVSIDSFTPYGPDFHEVQFFGNALNNVITVVAPVFDALDILTGNTYATPVVTIDGGAGVDTVIAQANTHIWWVAVDSTADIVQTVGNAVVEGVGSTATYTLGAGNIFNLTLFGTANINGTGNALNNDIQGNTGNNVLDGGLGNDYLFGNDGNDTLLGGLGNDDLEGGAGNDSLQGGAGDDQYFDVRADDTIVEAIGAGYDTAYLVGEIVTYTMAANLDAVHHEFAAGNTTVRGNVLDNHIFGGSYIDALYGDAGNDVLDGGFSTDALYGGAGNDTYIVNEVFDRVFENAPDGIDTVFSSADFFLSPNVENLVLGGLDDLRGYGNAINNVITGNAGNNLLSGGAGNDTLNGGAGFDDLFGGTGNDTYVYDGQDTLWEAFNEGIDTVLSSVDVNALFINIENLTLTGTANIRGAGNNLNNIITGNAGNNELSGGGGVDTLIGGAGNDRYTVGNGATVTETIAGAPGGIDEVVFTGSGTYVLGLNLENLTLGAGAGNINGTGNLADNVIAGNAGENVLDGGAGNDTLGGGAGNDTLIGGLGNDFLNGNAGDDNMKGGAGDDTYYVFSAGDVVDESTAAGGAGIDTVRSNLRTTNLNDTAIFKNSLGTLPAGLAVIENVTLEASALNVIGNSLANVIRGNGAVNVLSGGAGNDTYYVDLTDVVDESLMKFTPSSPADAGGVDTVIVDVGNASGTINMASRYANVENVTLLGTGNYNVQGTAAANILIGNDGNNFLRGDAGIDQMRGGKGDDGYQVDVAGDVVTELANEGIDTVFSQIAYTLGLNLENLHITGGGALAGTGNALNNEIWGGVGNNTLLGNDGNDILFGASGNDILNGGNGNDSLDGGYGNDAMTGGLGDDTFYVDSTFDTTLEAAAQGYDTVVAAVNYTLAAGQSIERLVAAPSGGDFDDTDPDFNVTGNNLDNLIVGNSGNNILAGGSGLPTTWGNDTFDASSGGNDTLNGGSGNDTFLFNGGSLDGADTVAGGAGSDTLIAEFAGTLGAVGAPAVLNIGNVEHLRFTSAQWSEAFIDFSPAAGTAGIQTITLSTAFGSGAEVGLYDLSGFGTIGTPTLLLQDFLGVAGMGSFVQTRLTNDGGPSDEVRFDLDGVNTRLDTLNVETVGLHVVGSGSGSAGYNVVTADFAGATTLNLSSANGAQWLQLNNLDNAAFTGDAQTIGLLGYQGNLELILDDASGVADEMRLELDNAETIVSSNGIELYEIVGLGAFPSGISLRNAQGVEYITVEGEGDILIRDFVSEFLDAIDFTGDRIRAASFTDSNGAGGAGGTGTTFFGAVDTNVSDQFFGGTGNDMFIFTNVPGSLSNKDSITGGDGLGSTDTVQADITGLSAGTTGALRFTGIELSIFTNTATASLDGSNMGGGQFNLHGSGTVGGAIDTHLVAFRGSLDASGYTGDVQVNAATNITVGHTYTLGTGNHNINGASAFGMRDTFNFSTIDNADLVNGFDTDTTAGGDVLNATVRGTDATTGALRIQGVETVNLTSSIAGNNVVGTDIDGVYFWNISGTHNLSLYGLDATSAVFDASGMTFGQLNLAAGAGNDTILGSDNVDTLRGGGGNDRIDGGGSASGNTLHGGAGNDTLIFSTSTFASSYDGGEFDNGVTDWLASGFDTLDASAYGGGITVNLSTNSVNGPGFGILTNIDRVIGGAGADSFTGFNLATLPTLTRTAADTSVTFRGNGGDDIIIGSNNGAENTLAGQAAWGYNTRIEFTGASAGVAVWLGMRGTETTAEFLDITGVDFGPTGIAVGTPGRAFDGDGGTDTISYIDLVRGSAHDDILVGGGDSRAYGGGRFEAFEGGAGNDLIAGGLHENAGDTDRVDYSNDPGSVYVDLRLGYAFDGYGGTDTLHEINDVRGSNFGDVLIGGNIFDNDFGEVFEGMGGDDVIDGGTGLDFVSFQAAPIALGAAGVTVNLVTGVSSGAGVGVDSFINIEGVRGSDGNDIITGGSSSYQVNLQSYESFRPNGGADTVDGGAGIDRIDYTNDPDARGPAFGGTSDGWGVLVNLGGALTAAQIAALAPGSDWDTLDLTLAANRAFDGWGYTDILLNIEDIRGSRWDDVLIGNSGANRLEGRNGSDVLTGGAGADLFVFNSGPIGVPNDNVDTITDFASGADKILLDDSLFMALQVDGLGTLLANRFAAGAFSVAQDADDRIIFNTSTGGLFYDSDGVGGTSAQQFATVTAGALTVIATDFQVI